MDHRNIHWRACKSFLYNIRIWLTRVCRWVRWSNEKRTGHYQSTQIHFATATTQCLLIWKKYASRLCFCLGNMSRGFKTCLSTSLCRYFNNLPKWGWFSLLQLEIYPFDPMIRPDYKQTGSILISQMASSVQNLECEFRVIPGTSVTKNISTRIYWRTKVHVAFQDMGRAQAGKSIYKVKSKWL